MAQGIDPKVEALAREVLAGAASKRAKAVIAALLERGSMSTDDLAALGYEHPPRAVRDVKDAGIPVVMRRVTSPRTGRPMAVYSFGTAEDIQSRGAGGRRMFPKRFKQDLLAHYGSRDRFSDVEMDPKILTIDHRIPYVVAGDTDELTIEQHMLLDQSSQRAKAWACGECPNMQPAGLDPNVCEACYWAYPERYDHIATRRIRRTEVVWADGEVDVHDRVKSIADRQGVSVAELLRSAARQIAKTS